MKELAIEIYEKFAQAMNGAIKNKDQAVKFDYMLDENKCLRFEIHHNKTEGYVLTIRPCKIELNFVVFTAFTGVMIELTGKIRKSGKAFKNACNTVDYNKLIIQKISKLL